MNLDETVFAGLPYIPGDTIATKDGKEFRIRATSKFPNIDDVWKELAIVREAEGPALVLLRIILGREAMDSLMADAPNSKTPAIIIRGKTFGGGDYLVRNPLLLMTCMFILDHKVSSKKADWNGWLDYIPLLGIFSEMKALLSVDYEYVKKIWGGLWLKANTLPRCEEIRSFYRLHFSGLKVSPLKESASSTPDFLVHTSAGPCFIERKVIIPPDSSERDEVLLLLYQRLAKSAERNETPVALGVRGSTLLRKAEIVSYYQCVDQICSLLSVSEEETIKICFSELEFIGMRIKRDTTSNLPEGFGMQLEIPLVKEGFVVLDHLYQAAWVTLPNRHIDMAIAMCVDISPQLWNVSTIERALKKATKQLRAKGRGLIHLTLPFSGQNAKSVEKQIEGGLSCISGWWNESERSGVDGVVVSFVAVQCLYEIQNPEIVEAFRVIERNMKFLSSGSLFKNVSNEELSCWIKAFPDIKLDIYSLEKLDRSPEHSKEIILSGNRIVSVS